MMLTTSFAGIDLPRLQRVQGRGGAAWPQSGR